MSLGALTPQEVASIRATVQRTAYGRFIEAHLAPIADPRLRWRAYVDLAALIAETRAAERRRLCTDEAALAAAIALTKDEIERHAVPQERSA